MDHVSQSYSTSKPDLDLILWTSYVWHLPSLLSIYNSLSTKPIISTFKLFKLTLPSYCNIPILPFILEFWILSFIQHILTMHWLLVYSATHWAGGRDMRQHHLRTGERAYSQRISGETVQVEKDEELLLGLLTRTLSNSIHHNFSSAWLLSHSWVKAFKFPPSSRQLIHRICLALCSEIQMGWNPVPGLKEFKRRKTNRTTSMELPEAGITGALGAQRGHKKFC